MNMVILNLMHTEFKVNSNKNSFKIGAGSVEPRTISVALTDSFNCE
jgi:hypothetical protein